MRENDVLFNLSIATTITFAILIGFLAILTTGTESKGEEPVSGYDGIIAKNDEDKTVKISKGKLKGNIVLQGYKTTKEVIQLKTKAMGKVNVRLDDKGLEAYYIDDSSIKGKYKGYIKKAMVLKKGDKLTILFKDYDDYQLYKSDIAYAKVKSGLE